MNEKFCILINISLEFVSKGSIDNNTALVWIIRHQAIIRINPDPIHLRIYALWGDELTM